MFVKGVALFLEVTVNAKFVSVVLCEADNNIAEHDTKNMIPILTYSQLPRPRGHLLKQTKTVHQRTIWPPFEWK